MSNLSHPFAPAPAPAPATATATAPAPAPAPVPGRLARPVAAQVLVVSGLSPVDLDPWQAWLERTLPGARWIRPLDGDWPDLHRWSARIDQVLSSGEPGRPWLVLAHGFGALALVHQVTHGLVSPDELLLVAPATPQRFGLDAGTLGQTLPVRSTVLALQGGGHAPSPWLQDQAAADWARGWGSRLASAGAGPGQPGPSGPRWVEGDEALASALSRIAPAITSATPATPAVTLPTRVRGFAL